MLVADDIPCSMITTPNSLDAEILCVKLILKNTSLIIVSAYRPPRHPVESFLNTLKALSRIPEFQSFPVILAGNFNAKNSQWYQHDSSNKAGVALQLAADTVGLVQIVQEGTRPVTVLPSLGDSCTCIPHLCIVLSPWVLSVVAYALLNSSPAAGWVAFPWNLLHW